MYFCTLRLVDKHGETLWGGHLRATTPAEARAKCEAAFFEPVDMALATDDTTRGFLETCEAHRNLARRAGFVIICRKSSADASQAID